tara:strand:+ start:5571 stop:6131 length:561 start_codon:yes stop_codon:yes gene_type:complete
MDCSGTDNVDLITLEYLSNTKQYERYVKSRLTDTQKQIEIDRKFYRKRVIQLTKQLMHGKSDDIQDIPDTLQKVFNSYLEECIFYFKTSDTVDLLQDEYKDMSTFESLTESSNTDSASTLSNIDEINNTLLITQPKSQKIEDCLNIRKIKGVRETVILPKKRDVDITNPELKKKGIKKKNKNKSNE